jgi:hypothetical protein
VANLCSAIGTAQTICFSLSENRCLSCRCAAYPAAQRSCKSCYFLIPQKISLSLTRMGKGTGTDRGRGLPFSLMLQEQASRETIAKHKFLFALCKPVFIEQEILQTLTINRSFKFRKNVFN